MANAVGDVIVQQRLTPNGKTKRKNPVRLEPAVKQNNMRKERRRKLSKQNIKGGPRPLAVESVYDRAARARGA